MAIDTGNIERILSELQTAGSVAQSRPAAPGSETPNADFGRVLEDAIDRVNASQSMAQWGGLGTESANPVELMANLQLALASFQQMQQTRNKLVEAYRDLMNMPV